MPTGRTSGKWVIHDLGTLWGKEESRAFAINNRGQIIGLRFVLDPASEKDVEVDRGPFLWEKGRMRDLGALRGATAINDSGQILGSRNESGEHPVVWQDGTLTDLAAVNGRSGSASFINQRGDVVGLGESMRDFHAVLWRGGHATDLGTLGGARSMAWGMNDRDQIVGWSDRSCVNVPGQTRKPCSARPFLWQNGRMTDLGSLGGHDWGGETGAAAINNRGWVVGSSYTAAKKDYGPLIEHAFLWRDGKMTDLSRSAGRQRESRATAINERGEIIGIASEDLYQCYHAFLWRNGTMADLGTLAGADRCYSTPFDINDRGYVVGTAATRTDEHAFVWHDGVMTDLGTLPGGGESRALAINERNQIVGWADTRTGKSHAVLWRWKPVD